ncbi:YkgJ family cysteine cluster protein [Methanolobus mangrovi]|uniref:YkgJ family cysteine cluster protein n=1 Tax=Methanolobus mangrovi TaxID=3072977 RepID=A0AA51UEH0_9EURY|nr:YkgJ family cysteine cluster protein [Methanolobus mangrovi]WMW21666.1 YkgJ family cysteine cluster protein [Methanolobus mangrovi]
MNITLRRLLIRELEEELEAAKKIDAERLAEEIQRTGFNCLMCGKCCRREFGDNRVALMPEEISRIHDGSSLTLEDIAEPFNIEAESPEEEYLLQKETDMVDEEGNIHTFGWMLQRKKNRDCIFIPDERTDNRCSIYELRPHLCSTYPFYMEGLKLRISECEGLGKVIGLQESRELAGKVLNRYVCELQDTILTYKNYNGFITGGKGQLIAELNLKQGYLNYIVHNSEGTCKITKRI